MITHTQLPDNKSKIYGGAWCIHDPLVVERRNELLQEFANINLSDKHLLQSIKAEYFNVYKEWMFKNFNWKGIELYNEACLTQGTTESFAQFYLRFGGRRRLRLARGEYFYHQMMKNLWYSDNFMWLEDDEIREGDFVLISVPFSDTGDVPINLEEMLCECDRLSVPVMLDLAFINLTNSETLSQQINLEHPCIEYIVSSLSKVFPVEHFRIGIRLQKTKFEDQLYVINEDNYNYLNFCSAYIGKELMKSFSSRELFNKYRPLQLNICKELNVKPSPCYIFGIDENNQYPEYSRGNKTNRLCFSRIWDGRAITEGLTK
jgi:hypothetical protein